MADLDQIISEKPADPFTELIHGEWCGIDLVPFLQDDDSVIDYDGKVFEEPRSWWYVQDCTHQGCSPKKFPRQAGAWSYISEVRCRIRFAVHLVNHPAHRMKIADALDAAFKQEVTVVANIETHEDLNEKSPPKMTRAPKERLRRSIDRVVDDAPRQMVRIGRAFDADHVSRILGWAKQSTTNIVRDVHKAMLPLKDIGNCIDTMHRHVDEQRFVLRPRYESRGHAEDRARGRARGRSRSNHQDS
jgi:hypothetical protein